MYYLLRIIFYPISLLPFWVLYGISHVMYVIVYQLLGYRKNVVMDNLQKSFPEKSLEELQGIAKKYYKNLCDSVVETIKLITLSDAELNKRYTCNWDVVLAECNKGRNVQAHLSHSFNWEYGTVASNQNIPHWFVGLYNRVSNKAFNKLMYTIRTRSGTGMVDMDDMLQVMGEYQKKNIVWGFLADQNPSEPRRGVWVNFFGRETSFFKGAELVARRYNNVVLFANTIRVKRGHFHLQLQKQYDNPNTTVDGEITHAYVQFLEDCIRQQPDNWVWSHRRWKHTRVKN
jgi:Kdo2-lipid IVA lauroyltransferase/acyltransferase